MIGGVTRHTLPQLSGVPHLHVNRPQDDMPFLMTLLIHFILRRELKNS